VRQRQLKEIELIRVRVNEFLVHLSDRQKVIEADQHILRENENESIFGFLKKRFIRLKMQFGPHNKVEGQS
jgi:asparagine synthetase B (glutamine-hydrolysing)